MKGARIASTRRLSRTEFVRPAQWSRCLNTIRFATKPKPTVVLSTASGIANVRQFSLRKCRTPFNTTSLAGRQHLRWPKSVGK